MRVYVYIYIYIYNDVAMFSDTAGDGRGTTVSKYIIIWMHICIIFIYVHGSFVFLPNYYIITKQESISQYIIL